MIPESGRGSDPRVRVAATAVVLAALAVPLWLWHPGIPVPAPPVRFPWWVLAIGFALAEFFVIDLNVRRESHSVSLGEIPFMLGLAMASPGALLAGRVVGATSVLVLHRRQAPHKVMFNEAILLLDTGVAVTLYGVLLAGRSQVSIGGLAAGFVALGAALVVGVLAVALALWLTQTRPGFEAAARSLRSGFAVGIVSASLAVGGLVLAWHDPLALIGVAVAAGGLYGVLRVYGRMGKRFGDLEAMYAFTSEMDKAAATDELVEVTLARMREFFGSEVAETVLSRGVGSTAVTLNQTGSSRRPAPPLLVTGLTSIVPAGEAIVAMHLEDAPEYMVRHYTDLGLAGSLVAVLSGGGGTATLLVVGPRSDGLRFDADDLRLFGALARHVGVSFERGRLVDRLTREISQKEHQTVHDALTGLPNRLHFTIAVEEALRQARDVDRRVAVLLVDLDRFKEVNDTLGHQRGDVLLQEMALRLSDALGGEEHVARLGGDEFGVLLRNLEGVNEAIGWARKLRAVMHQPFLNDGLALQVSGSIGIALAPDHGSDGTTLLRRADVAMYEAKERGSSFEVYDQQSDRYSTRRLAMAAELRSAIEMGEIRVAYQPQADPTSGRIVSFEALARWAHPRHSNVPPNEFVELAVHTGLIGPLTEHMLRTALRDIRRIPKVDHPIGVAVNIAAPSLLDENFPGLVERLLDEYEVAPQSLTLEVTESTMMTDSARARLVLGALADLGVDLSIDDYGTGYSSLAYLSTLPVHEVKIDRAFVTDMAVDERLEKIVSSTTALVHGLGKRVVAEGVENSATWDLLVEAGCDLVQGYYLARPMSFLDVLSWLDSGAVPEGEESSSTARGATLD